MTTQHIYQNDNYVLTNKTRENECVHHENEVYAEYVYDEYIYEEDEKKNPKPSSIKTKPNKNHIKPVQPKPNANSIKTKRDSQNYDLPDLDNENKPGKSCQNGKQIASKKIESWLSNVSRKHIMGCVLVSFVMVVIIVLSVVFSLGDVDKKLMSSTTGSQKGKFLLSLPCEITQSTLKNKNFLLENDITKPLEIKAFGRN